MYVFIALKKLNWDFIDPPHGKVHCADTLTEKRILVGLEVANCVFR